MRCHAYAERQDAFDAVYHLGMFGLTATVHEYPAEDGYEAWVMWEVRVDELPAQRMDAPELVARALEDRAEYEHDAGRSTWWDEYEEAKEDIRRAHD